MIKPNELFIHLRNIMQEQELSELKSGTGLLADFHMWGGESLMPSIQLPVKRKGIRSQMEIEVSILDSCRTANVQHWVMVKARLGYDTFWKHMNYLLTKGLVDEKIEGSRTLYQTSARGLELLEKVSTINEVVNGFWANFLAFPSAKGRGFILPNPRWRLNA